MIQVNSTVAPLYLRPVLTVPPDTVPDPVLIAIHDLERGNRALVPMLDSAQNGLDVVGD
jgi:hypothetical protein